MLMHQLEKSCYKTQIEAMQVGYSLNATAYLMLASLVHALQCRDIFNGKLFGGALSLLTSCQSEIIKTGYSGFGFIKKVQFSTVSSVVDTNITDSSIQDKNPWIGGMELDADQVVFLKCSCKCIVCHLNGCVLQFCPFMKNYKIRKKLISQGNPKSLEDGINGSVSSHTSFHKSSLVVDLKIGKPMGLVSAVTAPLEGNHFESLSIIDEESENDYPALLKVASALVDDSDSENDSVNSSDIFILEIVESVEADVGLAVNATITANVVYLVLDSLLVKPMGSARVVKRGSSWFPSLIPEVLVNKMSKLLAF